MYIMEKPYHSDIIHKKKDTVPASRDTGVYLHFDNLFDLDETATGEKYDLATGKPIDNSTETDLGLIGEEGHIVIPGGSSSDVLGKIPESSDDAAANEWLRNNEDV
ncbi:MAG: hypothetical protein NVS1B10_03050 [Candidatus Saccharimonadales bacterium]